MTNAQLTALRMIAHSMLDVGGSEYPLSVTKTADGYEARRGGKLVGVSSTRAGALELLDVLVTR
jgi:hypothetical protein